MGRPSKKTQESVVENADPVLIETKKDTEEVQTSDPLRTLKTVSVSFEQKEVIVKNENDVTFEYNYPKDFNGKKWFKDGDKTIISKESAELFQKQGIGKIVK